MYKTNRKIGKIIIQNKYMHTKENLEFNYQDIFDQNSSQEEILEKVAKPVLVKCLEGYNGTIFCYGQTGSGKTYTMSGAESWQQRGLIPRILSLIFDEFEKKKDTEYSMFVSFMEIYNEHAYDLLEKRHLQEPIDNWNKITLMEDDFGNIHLRNISVHHCSNEQEGIDWLMMGNFIRQVSATPINQSSSRSHCIFTINIEGREKNSQTCFVSKLHLVDLAGSERVSKSMVEGSLLNEAKYINLSLTYLEQVIIALNEKRKGGIRKHIPYRNSLLTTILKDSLGGNCKTVMIANISPEQENYEESLSTLRFVQRVGQLENEISRNEKVDLQMVVNKLEIEKQVLMRDLEYYKNFVKNLQNLNKESAQSLGDKFIQQRIKLSGSAEIQTDTLNQASNQKSLQSLGASGGISMSFGQINNQLINSNENLIENTSQEDYEILHRVDQFLNEKVSELQVSNLQEAQKCFNAMKELYNTRMKEYVTELTFISEKLQQYDELLSLKKEEKKKQRSQNGELANNSDETDSQNGINQTRQNQKKWNPYDEEDSDQKKPFNNAIEEQESGHQGLQNGSNNFNINLYSSSYNTKENYYGASQAIQAGQQLKKIQEKQKQLDIIQQQSKNYSRSPVQAGIKKLQY